MVFHLTWFVRYACLKRHTYVHNVTSHTKNLNKCQNIHITYHRIYHISLERYLCHLKWVFHDFSFGFFFWEISLIEGTYVCKNNAQASPDLQQTFSHSLYHQRESMLYGWKFLFNISNGSSMEFNFITFIKIYEWICSETSTLPKTIFFTFMKSYCNHGYGLTTQNPWLGVNHTKPIVMVMVRGQPHKTHSYGLTT